MKSVHVRLPPDLIRELHDQASRRGLDFSSYVRTQLLALAGKPANIFRTPKSRASDVHEA